jgi:hypothetical protein
MGKTKFSRQNGKVHVHGHKYENLQGTRAQVWHGTAYKTAGDLTKKNLMQNKHGRIVSRKLHDRAKREKRLEKAGYKTKKGKFGSFHVSGKTHRKGKGRGRGKKHRGGSSGIGSRMGQNTGSMGQNMGNKSGPSNPMMASQKMSGGRRHKKSCRSRGGMYHRGGMSALNPSTYDGRGVGTSGANLQLAATNY